MDIRYIAQPEKQLGKLLFEMLGHSPLPTNVYFVSAFVSVQAIMRIKHQILNLRDKGGTEIRFIVGIDLGGTSQEVLKELLGWGINVRIVKHRLPRHTFHPKLYFFKWTDRATIVIGSHNLTEGGLFGNYESSAQITYKLPAEMDDLESAYNELRSFLEPDGPISYPLTEKFFEDLVARGEIPTEAEAQWIKSKIKHIRKSGKPKAASIFGTEEIPPPPPLPPDLLERLVKNVRASHKASEPSKAETRKKGEAYPPPYEKQIVEGVAVAAFYMTLPKLQGPNLPGEGRIPLEAIELAKDFWGWPNEYIKEVSAKGKDRRVYWNWRPRWKFWSVENPEVVTTREVRMYMYENSSDFRFYSRPLVDAGGNIGDVVQIRRIGQDEAEFECVLAKQGSSVFGEWIKCCSQPVRNSSRRFGYA